MTHLCLFFYHYMPLSVLRNGSSEMNKIQQCALTALRYVICKNPRCGVRSIMTVVILGGRGVLAPEFPHCNLVVDMWLQGAWP